MPRYHFHTECGDVHYHDQDGIELESIEHAQQQLVGLLRDMTMHDDPAIAKKTVTARVMCEGHIALQGSCSLAISRPTGWSPKL
jgi:hypothetical protein